MNEMEQKINIALRQQPDFSQLNSLSNDVRNKVRTARKSQRSRYFIPNSIKVSALALSILAFVAISQVSFQADHYQADIFDLRFFSHQSIPSLNLASVNTYEYSP